MYESKNEKNHSVTFKLCYGGIYAGRMRQLRE